MSERITVLDGSQVGAGPEVTDALARLDTGALANQPGHFSAVHASDRVVRMARTLGAPLRYFVAKIDSGPWLVTAPRIDAIARWCAHSGVSGQFHPAYTRMVPAHHVVEVRQPGCPDPSPTHHRFFEAPTDHLPADLDTIGKEYVGTLYEAIRTYIEGVPRGETIGVCLSGGIDSTAVFLLAHRALLDRGREPSDLRAFTLTSGGGADAQAAGALARRFGLSDLWEPVDVSPEALSIEQAIDQIEDYHPLDVQCAAVLLALLTEVRHRHPHLVHLLDGDGADENLRSYPLEDSRLTMRSVLDNPLLYIEGWGVDSVKHSLTYSGGLSRSYVRTHAPARALGFSGFSPYTLRPVIATALRIPLSRLVGQDPTKLYALKGEVMRRGLRSVAGLEVEPVPKRRFQEGAAGLGVFDERLACDKARCLDLFQQLWRARCFAAS